jgi:hypothetical protein
LEKSYRKVDANRRDECDANRDDSVSDDVAPVHKSSRMPLKNGCRTLPSANFARYSISTRSSGHGRRLLTLEGHAFCRLNQPQRQLARPSAIGINKVSDVLGHGLARNVAPGLNFLSDVFGNVVCPMLQSIEGYDASRVIKLPRHKVTDDGFEIRSLDLGLAENAAGVKAINYQINRLIRAIRHGIRRPARSGHRNTPTQQETGDTQPFAYY